MWFCQLLHLAVTFKFKCINLVFILIRKIIVAVKMKWTRQMTIDFLIWDCKLSTMKRNWEETLQFRQFRLCRVYFIFSTEYINSFMIRKWASFQNGHFLGLPLSLLFFWCFAVSEITQLNLEILLRNLLIAKFQTIFQF